MTLKEIIQKCSGLDVHEERDISDEYCELVFFSQQAEQWTAVLSEMLGGAKKPAGAEPTEEDDALTGEYGGIFANQTLFKKDFADSTVIAMFWPWQNGVHTTLKMACIKRQA